MGATVAVIVSGAPTPMSQGLVVVPLQGPPVQPVKVEPEQGTAVTTTFANRLTVIVLPGVV